MPGESSKQTCLPPLWSHALRSSVFSERGETIAFFSCEGSDMTTHSPRLGRRAAAILAGAATLVALSFAGAAPASASSRTTFAGSKPAWATSSDDSGTPAADTSVEGEIYLPLRDEAGAEALATAVSTPGSRLYR